MEAIASRLGTSGRGAAWMVLAALSFTVLLVSVRHLSATFPTIEIVFVRALVGIVIVVPLVARSGLRTLRTQKLPLHALRTLFALLAMVTLYYSLAHIPVADATALTFLIPMFTTAAAALVLKEVVDAPRWIATLVGFVGAMIIIRPGFATLDVAVLLAAASSLFYAGAWSTVKFLTKTDSAAVTVFYMNVMMLPLTLIPSLFVWVTPTWADIPALLIMAVSGWAAHFCQARSFAAADASAVMPFDFLRLPFGALLALLLFGEVSDLWTWIGGAVIFASGYYTTIREARTIKQDKATTR